MLRALSVKNILDKRYKTFPLKGAWYDFIGHPETSGVWIVWGNSGNGKTSFIMQLCKELCKYDRVLFDSLEEGTRLTMQDNLKKFGMGGLGSRLHFVAEDMETLKSRLLKHKSYNIIVIDSFQYTGMSYRDYRRLKEAFPGKLFIFTSHAKGKEPKTDAAVSVMYDASLKIWVEYYRAFTKGRFQGPKRTYDIWPEEAAKYFGDNDRQSKEE